MTLQKSKLSDLKNIGTKTEKWLNDFDIYTRGDIEKYGPVTLYKILKANGYKVNLIFIYALQGALMDLHWNKLPIEVKEKLNQEINDQ